MMLLALVAAACMPVDGPRITAKDVSAVVSGFVPQDPATVFGYSPTPGVQRVVHAIELQQFLKRESFQGTMPVNDVCFIRPTALLTEDAVIKAMQTALGGNAHIEVVEISRFPAPIGTLTFPREDLGAPPVALWHGYVSYDGDKKFPVWARVRVSVRTQRVIAAEDLRPGIPIQTGQVVLQAVEEFPNRRATATRVDKVEGSTPRHFIAASSPVYLDSIDPPNQVSRGDSVSVTVRSGLARFVLDAEAQSSGRFGDFVSLKNSESGKLFRARVEGPGRAAVETLSIKP